MLCTQFLFWYISHKWNYGILATPARTIVKTRLKLLLQETRLDVLAISETHLHKHIENDQLEIEENGIARKDRQNG